jgi:regulator of replication initiation timing
MDKDDLLAENARLKAEVERLRRVSINNIVVGYETAKAEVEAMKEKMKTLPTRQIDGKWYTEGQFQQLIQDARNFGL